MRSAFLPNSATHTPYRELFESAFLAKRLPSPVTPQTFSGNEPAATGEALNAGLLEELGLDMLVDSGGPKHLFQFSQGSPVGISFTEKLHKREDPYIEGAPTRKLVSRHLSESNPDKQVRWRENAGVLHLGGQISSFVPLGALPGTTFGAYFSFAADAILRYRVLTPEFFNASRPNEPRKREPLNLPLTPALALEMDPGREVEVIGAIKARVGAGIFFAAGKAMGPALFGAAAFAESSIAGAKECSINVVALDRKGHVRVSIRKLNQVSSSFALGITAGVLYQLSNSWGSIIGGNFSLLPNTGLTASYLSSITGSSTASAGINRTSSELDTLVASFDLDLNDDAAKTIYSHLLKLKIRKATALAKKNPQAAKMAFALEDTHNSQYQAYFGTLGETIASRAEITKELTGEFSFSNGESISFLDQSLTKNFSFWITGSRGVTWQEVLITKKGNSQGTPYFRFQLADQSYRFNVKRLYEFLRFAKGLGISKRQLNKLDMNGFTRATQKLSKASRVDINIDIFLTTLGVERIMNATTEEIQKAYILASQKTKILFDGTPLALNSESASQARGLLEQFERIQKKRRWDIFQISPKLNACYREYEKLTGRPLSVDYGLLDQARNFAAMLKLEVSGSGPLLQLAKKKHFDFAQTIATLVNLAGRDETRIHALSLESCNKVKFAFTPEAELEHPEETFSQSLLEEV